MGDGFWGLMAMVKRFVPGRGLNLIDFGLNMICTIGNSSGFEQAFVPHHCPGKIPLTDVREWARTNLGFTKSYFTIWSDSLRPKCFTVRNRRGTNGSAKFTIGAKRGWRLHLRAFPVLILQKRSWNMSVVGFHGH